MDKQIGTIICKKRKEIGLTQNQLAQSIGISFQAVSKWENGTAYPDIELLPKLAAQLNTTVDALLGYSGVVADYDSRYKNNQFYWGLRPNVLCYDVMKILPPIKPYRVLDIGCGEGKDAVFLARCGYSVTAMDISEVGLEKAKNLAEHNQVQVNFFKADIIDFRPNADFDIIFSSGLLHFVPDTVRKDLCESLKAHTSNGGINALNVFVKKPFIDREQDDRRNEKLRHPWLSGELFGY